MSKSQNQKTAGGFLYIFCAVLIAAIICIALVTLISPSAKKTSKKTDEVTIDTSSADTESTVTANTEVASSDTGTDTTAPPSENASTEPVQYYLPVSGSILKTYDPLLAVFSMTMNDYRAHTGVDVSAQPGDPVCCFTDGKITDVYDDKFWGTCVEVEHDGGLCSVYRNLSPDLPENIAPGCVVGAGAQIASVGESAKIEAADSPHLHFELIKDGIAQDPTEYLSFPESEAPTED